MHNLILYIIALALYATLGTALAYFVTKHPSGNLKVKVAIWVFVHPIIYWLIIFTAKISFDDQLFLALLVLAGFIRYLFSNRKFLVQANFTGDALQIQYLSPLLKTYIVESPRSQLKQIKLDRTKWWIDYPPGFRVNDNGVDAKFTILDKTLQEETANKMNIAGIETPN